MRIGIIAPPWLSVPPVGYGGTEVVIDTLTRGLVEVGHDVVLFASGDSTCDVERRWVIERAQGIGVGGSAVEVHHVVHAYHELKDREIIHDHTIFGPIYSLGREVPPVVTTNHNPFSGYFETAYRVISGKVPIVAVSHHHASSARAIEIAAVIHHGLDISQFPFGNGDGGYALFLGRMSSDKGAHRAVAIARRAGIHLVLAGRVREESEKVYFEEMVKPLLSRECEFVGEIEYPQKVDLLSRAACLLNPIAWPEPFGMTMIEALACGTPVLALANGAATEIVDDGLTGFLCDSEDGLVAATGRLNGIDRAACRAAAVDRFSSQRMVHDYVELFEDVISSREKANR